MLQTKVLQPKALDLLKYIQSNISKNHNIRLVGGTALALKYGHRSSIDLDFFGKFELQSDEILELLKGFGKTTVIQNSPNIYVFYCEGVKVDFVNYRYDWLEGIQIIDNIYLAGDKDIAAMKIAAITGRGSKKDFYDLSRLLDVFTISEIFKFYTLKYPDISVFLANKSLIYFEDAELEPDPELFDSLDWDSVKRRIIEAHKTLS